MDKILKSTVKTSSGTIELPDEVPLSRSGRPRNVMENPVAYVIESKTVINDIRSLLIGAPAQECFSYYDSGSSSITMYYKLKKGILGHCLSYIGVVEDHARGTLHYNLLFLAAFLHMFSTGSIT